MLHTNFLHNNEYFGPLIKGYTLLGYLVNPQIAYHPSANTQIVAGWSFLKYDGENFAYQSQPTFSFQYAMSPHINLVLGTIYGSVEHKMIDPILNSERYYTAHNENGIQFLFQYPYLRSDVWINWEAFEHVGSMNQEQFTQGTSSELRLSPLSSKSKLSLDLQTTLCHRGGQIDSLKTPIQTLINMSVGLKYDYQLSADWTVGLRHYLCTFTNNSIPMQTPYSSGQGQYTQLCLSGRSFDLVMSHWKGRGFLSGRGDYFYSSRSYTFPEYLSRDTHLATARLVYRKPITKGITLGARYEAYYYIKETVYDYSYSLYIVFNRDFLISGKH